MRQRDGKVDPALVVILAFVEAPALSAGALHFGRRLVAASSRFFGVTIIANPRRKARASVGNYLCCDNADSYRWAVGIECTGRDDIRSRRPTPSCAGLFTY